MSDVLAHCPNKGRCNDCVTIRLLFTSKNRNHITLNPGVSADNLIVMCIIIENHLIICLLPGIYPTPLSLTCICIIIIIIIIIIIFIRNQSYILVKHDNTINKINLCIDDL